MPHKHKRRHGIRDDDIHDLPPTTIAKPLPPKEWKDDKGAANDKGKRNRAAPAEAKPNDAKSAEKSKKKKKAATMADDTPKAFARLMRQMEGKLPSGPTLDDDAEERRKKKKAAKDGEEPSSNDKKDTKETATADANLPKILPGEKLSDFAARVDQMMPLSGISKNRAKTIAGIKLREGRTTKHEKHLRRLQKGWREEEARLKEKEEAERDEKEAEMDEIREKWAALEAEAGAGKKRKGHKGRADMDDEDPWAKLKKRDREVLGNPLETVEAPPQLVKPRPKFKMYRGAQVDVDSVPTAAGSLRRREELKSERESIVEQYRRLMAQKRGE